MNVRTIGLAACVTLLLGIGLSMLHSAKKETDSQVVLEKTAARMSKLQAHMEGYEILNDTYVYSRYARVYDRVVRYPTGDEFAYDVWGRNWKTDTFSVVIVVPYDVHTKTMTLIKEYNVAHHRFVYGFPTGMVSKDKHKSPRDAAQQELDEEAMMTCNNLIDLLSPAAIDGVPQDKYQREKIYMFLCLDEEKDDDPNDRDDEEIDLHVERRVPVSEVKALLRAGTFQTNNVAAAYLALDELTERGYRF